MAAAISAILRGGCLDALDDLLQRLAGLVAQLAPFLDPLRRFLDERGDLAGRLVGSLGQLADLVGHDGEAHAVLAGAGRLDGGVQRQQIRLAGDLGDHLDDLADLLRTGADQLHGLDRLLHGRAALLGQAAGLPGRSGRPRAALSLTVSIERASSSIEAVISSTLDSASGALGQGLRALGDDPRALGELVGALGDLADDAGQVVEHLARCRRPVRRPASLPSTRDRLGEIALGGGADHLQQVIDLLAEFLGRLAFGLGLLALPLAASSSWRRCSASARWRSRFGLFCLALAFRFGLLAFGLGPLPPGASCSRSAASLTSFMAWAVAVDGRVDRLRPCGRSRPCDVTSSRWL